jgi:PAS domain S-box-containing protein
MCIVEDITEQNILMEKLRESEKNYRRLFEYSTDAHLLFDHERVYDCNEQALRMFGFSGKEEMISCHPMELSPLYQEDGSASSRKRYDIIEETFRKGYNKFEWTHCRKNGEHFPAEVWVRSFTLDGRRVLQSTVRDITARKNTADDLLKAKVLAESANRAKNDFLANMSHELRTPLNAIIGFSDVLVGGNFGPLNEKQTRYANNISKSGKHLLGIINNILDLSKVEAGKMEMEFREFSVKDAVVEVRSILMSIASKKNIELTSNIDPGLFVIKADMSKFKQILYNLVSNALKFTPDGGTVTINAILVGEVARFDIIDNGIGMSPENLENVFKPFVQLDCSASRKYPGTGLGLAIVKRLVEMHGGNISVKSEPGNGSTFTFMLPARR